MLHIYNPCFSDFWHCHSYIFQHFCYIVVSCVCFVTVELESKNIKFKQETYSVEEDKGQLTVSVERSRNIDESTVVLIATHPTKGTAIGMMHNYGIHIWVLCLANDLGMTWLHIVWLPHK